MSSLPVVSGADAVRAFENLGWEVARRRSSHIILLKDGELPTLSVPDHDEVAKDIAETDTGSWPLGRGVCCRTSMDSAACPKFLR